MKWLVLMSIVLVWCWRQRSMELSLRPGVVQGERNSRGHHQFFSIPYAHTNKENRFQAPLPAKKWNGVYDAIQENIRCPQRFAGGVMGQEDCLTLNVYTPQEIQSKKPLPVLFFIHGGAFLDGSGSSAFYGPDYFMDKGIVLVTVNYRLNILGFLCLGIKEAPGNAGMKDQVAALRWVKENIRAFGGDPDNVTIFGQSAGAASASYHLLSPMSKGLFHKVILQSGSSLTAWANQYDPVYSASLVAKQMGHETKDPVELYNIFMSKTDVELIQTTVPREKGHTIVSEIVYSPCVEKKIPGVEAFLTDSPINLLSRGEYNKVPMIIGWTNEEGLLFAAFENDTTLAEISVEKSLPKDLVFPSEHEKSENVDILRNIYFGGESTSKSNLLQVSKLHGVPYFEYPGAQESELILKTNNHQVFIYKFVFDGWLNEAKIIKGMKDMPGATHADEIPYLFKQYIFPLPLRYLESQMVERMTTLWTNFAKFGEPTPETTELLPVKWLPSDIDDPKVFLIDREFSEEPLWASESLRLWREIYSKYRRKH